jgi:hypothetical protein
MGLFAAPIKINSSGKGIPESKMIELESFMNRKLT